MFAKGIVSSLVDWLLVVFGVWCIVHRPGQGPLRVTVKIGPTVYQEFMVRPGSEIVTYRRVWDGQYQEDSGFVWGGIGLGRLVVVTNRL